MNPYNRAPMYAGGMNVPGAPGNLGMYVDEVAEMPRFIRGNYAPGGAIIKAPHLDSPYIDEQIRRGWTPMTPPPGRSPGPQLFPLVQAPANFDMKYVS
jgi:hypothetical protein